MRVCVCVCVFGTFVDQLPPALGPLCELLGVGLLDAGALVEAVHQVVTQAVAVVHALHRPLVVPHLGGGGGGGGGARGPAASRRPPRFPMLPVCGTSRPRDLNKVHPIARPTYKPTQK